MSWFLRHRPKGDRSAVAVAVEGNVQTATDTNDQVRATRPEDRIVTSVVSH